MAHLDCGDAILLDRRRLFVAAELDIAEHRRVKSSRVEGGNRLDALFTLLNNADLSDARDTRLAAKINVIKKYYLPVKIDSLWGALVGFTEEDVLKLRVLRADVSLFAIPFIDASIAIPVALADLLILVGSFLDPLGRLSTRRRVGRTDLGEGEARLELVQLGEIRHRDGRPESVGTKLMSRFETVSLDRLGHGDKDMDDLDRLRNV